LNSLHSMNFLPVAPSSWQTDAFQTGAGPKLNLRIRRVKELLFLYLIATPKWCIGNMKVKLHVSFNSANDGGKWSAQCAQRFIPGKRETGTHWAGGRLGLRTGLKTVAERKICPWQESISDRRMSHFNSIDISILCRFSIHRWSWYSLIVETTEWLTEKINTRDNTVLAYRAKIMFSFISL
jgi:hypothetical protein